MNNVTEYKPTTTFSEAARLYAAFVAADAAFQAQLVKDHGKRAGVVRYLNTEQSAACAKLRVAYQSAGTAWRAECNRLRAERIDINPVALAKGMKLDAMRTRLDEAEPTTAVNG